MLSAPGWTASTARREAELSGYRLQWRAAPGAELATFRFARLPSAARCPPCQGQEQCEVQTRVTDCCCPRQPRSPFSCWQRRERRKPRKFGQVPPRVPLQHVRTTPD